MPSFQTMLEQMAIDLFSKGNGVPEPLAAVFHKTDFRQLLTLSLESIYGSFLTVGADGIAGSNSERNLKTLPALADEQKNEKRFFFSMSEKRWEVLSAFTLATLPFFTTLTLDISNAASAPVRSGLFKLADYFTVQCRKHLQNYINNLFQQTLSYHQTAGSFVYEKSVLEKMTAFSSDVECAVLLDEDGFIIHTEGSTGSVDELGGALARLFYRSNHEIARLDCAECNAITLADHEYTICIGRLTGTSLAFAVSVGGLHANAYAHFLHTTASAALTDYALRTGQLWGVALASIPEPTRTRKSWFGLPWLVPHGKFVGKKGGKSFHTATCQILAKTDTALLHWFDSRAAAIQDGLRPCGACNP